VILFSIYYGIQSFSPVRRHSVKMRGFFNGVRDFFRNHMGVCSHVEGLGSEKETLSDKTDLPPPNDVPSAFRISG